MSAREAEIRRAPAGEAPSRPLSLSDRLDAVVPIAATATAFACLARVGVNGNGLIAAVAGFLLVWLSAIDLREHLLPNRIVLPGTAFLLVAHVALEPSHAPEWLLSAFGAGAIFLLPALIRPDALGMGDVKLAMFLGALLGGAVVSALALGLLAAGIFAVGLVLSRGRAALRVQMPLGPFLAFGGLVLLLA
jgi:leader peptidase (prepilin peptidase)/N-methyltransferase